MKAYEIDGQVWVGACQPWWRRLCFAWLRIKPVRFD